MENGHLKSSTSLTLFLCGTVLALTLYGMTMFAANPIPSLNLTSSSVKKSDKDAKLAAPDLLQDYFTSITFRRNLSDLSSRAVADIADVIAQAKLYGEIGRVFIFVWPDREIGVSKSRLGKAEVDLAKQRADAIEVYIEEIAPMASISFYNMAADPTSLTRLIDIKNEQVRTRLISLGFKSDSQNNYSVGRPSTANVIVQLKGEP